MYGPAFKKLKDIQYLDWPTYNNEKSIKDISIRIINEYNIDSSDIVGGSSLGGMVSAEIAKNVDAMPHAHYFEQAKNGVIVRMALLGMLLGAKW